MDCCNYVAPNAYASTMPHQQQHHHHQHYYSQQHHQMMTPAYNNCYDYSQSAVQAATTPNAPPTYAPVSQQQQQQQQQQIEVNAANAAAAAARYRMQTTAYPNDYVYNPKEARLRKAMREQSRSTTASAVVASVSNSSSILHQQQQQGVGTAAAATPQQQQQQQGVAAGGVSPLPGGGPAAANRIIGPWFPPQPSTHPKPILSPRVMAAHQRTLDKTKDVIRKQLEGYPAYHHHHHNNNNNNNNNNHQQDYGMLQENHHHHHHPHHHHHHHHPQDYLEYANGDRQKWHPYQNGANAYHSRSALMSKMNSLHHRGMPSPPAHPTSPWGQFCNVPFPTSQSAMMRSNRHMVFLPEHHHHQQQMSHQQHLSYPDELRLSYEAKMQDDLARRLHPASYPPQDQQMKSPLASLHELAHDDKSLNGNQSGVDDGPRWDTPRPSSVSSSSCTTDTLLERESELQQQPPPAHQQQRSTKPLPGFQQAFGSTEIGKFSRSELFASLVEAATCNNNVSNCSDESPPPESPEAPATPLAGESIPRWHSPYAIGSEI